VGSGYSLCAGATWSIPYGYGNYPSTAVSSSATSLAAGDQHTCAVVSGGVRCWGYNDYGQVGQPTTSGLGTPSCSSASTFNSPTWAISPDSGATQVVAGGNHSCALFSTGLVKCWGANGSGQLGYTGSNSSSPVTIDGLYAVRQLAAGSSYAFHTCATIGNNTDGETEMMRCWGQNYNSHLDNYRQLSLSPYTPPNAINPTVMTAY
jgi:alpha-tubulin suppressor-like RCC1 family protein